MNKDSSVQSLEIDPNMQYILAGDTSGSMNETDSKCNNMKRYDYMLEKFESFIREAGDFDKDGATVMLFNDDVTVFRNTTLEAVQSKLKGFSCNGWTRTDLAIEKAWELHRQEKGTLAKEGKLHPGTVLFIFTDGAATNRAAVARIITKITKEVDKHDEFNIGFLTVGTIDPALRDWLTSLDDDLKEAKYDIVNVSALEDVTFLKAVTKAINE